MLHVLFNSPRVDQDVIYEDHHELIHVWLKHPVHVIHKDSRSIGYPEWHNQELIMTVSRPKSSLRYIRTLNPNLMISRPEVNLREHTGSFQLIQEVINPWKRILVLYGYLVQLTIVDAQTHTTVLLLH